MANKPSGPRGGKPGRPGKSSQSGRPSSQSGRPSNRPGSNKSNRSGAHKSGRPNPAKSDNPNNFDASGPGASGGPNKGPRGPKGGLGKRKTDNFNKFYNKKRNSAIKEGFRQEKKAEKRERKAAIERHFEERRASRSPQTNSGPGRKPFPSKEPVNPNASKGPIRETPKGPAHSDTPKDASQPRSRAPFLGGAPKVHNPNDASGEILPLNKYISNGGICSRRDAAELIRQGKVTVNGQPVTEPGTKVHPTDLVKVGNKKVTISNNFVYILLNKPKDYITTTEDPEGRRTVLELIRAATTERVYPVGRLDRNTSGVLLFTNDGDLAQKLAHPSHQIKKIYHVTLDKPLTRTDFDSIAAGTVVLEDGAAPVDALAYADTKDKTQIGLEIHSGRNRIVRRIFEHLGYDVRGLDRVMYAGLTKKNVQRGMWRMLSEKEVRVLKYLNSAIKGSAGRAKDLALTDPEANIPPERPARPDRERTANPEHTDRPKPKLKLTPRRDQTDHPEQTERSDRPVRPERPAHADRPKPVIQPKPAARRDRPAKPERRPDHRNDRPGKPDRRAEQRPPAPGIRPKTRRPGKPRRPSGPRPPKKD